MTAAKKKKFNFWAAFILIILGIQFIYIYAFFIEPNWIAVKKVIIKSPRLAHVLENIRIIQISDLHITEIGFLETSLIEKVNSLKPDIILITGDFVNSKAGIKPCWDVLRLLEAKTGIYAIAGDIDMYWIANLLNDSAWQKAGVTMLLDRSIKLNPANKQGKDFWLVGLHKASDLKNLIEKIPTYEPILLMTPDPDSIHKAAQLSIDLVLTGDTHGGQVNPRLLRNLFPFAVESHSLYVAGLFKIMNTLLYVNRGIGTNHINVRFFCRPEITVFDFVATGAATQPQILPQDRSYTTK